MIGGRESPAILRLLPVLQRVGDELESRGRRLVLIGGLAVVARVASADRATTDIDSIFDAPEHAEETVELLAAAGIGRSAGPDAPQRRIVDGVPVDCIDTHRVEDRDLEGMSPHDALFVGGHRFAYETAETVELHLGHHAVTTSVATPAGLVATKLHAALHRRQPQKRAGDFFDLYRLLSGCDLAMMVDTLTVRPHLMRLVELGIADLFVEHATATAGRIRTISGTRADAISDAEVTAVGELFLGLIS